MKEIAKYHGKVEESINSDLTRVTLKDLTTNKIIDTVIESKRLIAANIISGDEFEVIIQESLDANVSGFIRKINNKLDISIGEQLEFKFDIYD